MLISEVEDFSQFEVYELIGEKKNEYHCLCICKEYEVARTIAIVLALKDKNHDKYYVSNVSRPNTFVVGGGWYDCFWTDENGKLKTSSLE